MRPKVFQSIVLRMLLIALISAVAVLGVKMTQVSSAATTAVTRIWNGTGNPLWSKTSNWIGNTAPLAGDNLVFPNGAKRKSNRNNFPNFTNFNSITFSGSSYHLKRNAFSLDAVGGIGITTSNVSGTNQLDNPIRLNASQTFVSTSPGTMLMLNGGLNLNSNQLTLAGAGGTQVNGLISGSSGINKIGTGTLTLVANNTYTGATTLNAGTLLVNGSQPGSDVNVNGGILGGIGTVGAVTASAGSVRPGTTGTGILRSGNLTLSPSASLVIDLNGITVGTNYDQLRVTGTINLGSSRLDASVGFLSAPGQTFTIITNDGSDPVNGTFQGVPEGATLILGGLPFSITYAGGDGNDIVLTRLTSQTTPPTLTINDVSVSEGDSGTTSANFTLSLSAPSGQPVSVDFTTVDVTATAVQDYLPYSLTHTLTFAPGETGKAISVLVVGDALNETDETFFVNLRNSTNAAIVDNQGTGTILNDDPLPTLTIDDVSVTEGNTGTTPAPFQVTLSAPSGQAVSVDFATADGTAVVHQGNDSDYVSTSGTLTFDPGIASLDVLDANGDPVPVNGDTAIEPNQNFSVNLSNAINAVIADTTGTATIIDDDVAGALDFDNSDYSVIENAGTVTLTVMRSGNSNSATSVNYATGNGTAIAGSDYAATSGTLNFATGETSKTFNVPVINNSSDTGSRTIIVTLGSPTFGAVLGAQATALITIIDDDAPAVQFSAANFNVAEAADSATITVTRTGDTSTAATVDFATSDSSAQQRTDYTLGAGTLNFAAGETSKTFDVLIIDDVYTEGDEVLNLSLSNPTGGAVLGGLSNSVITIQDNDSGSPSTNPSDDGQFFVRLNYYDFLSRLPDQGGLSYWTNQITSCGPDQLCVNSRRIGVSNAFFYEQEFQETGAYVYRIYKIAFAAIPSYAQFMPDRSRVIGGVQLDQSKTDFANAFAQRAAFLALYPNGMTSAQYVDALNANTGSSLTQSERDALITGLQNSVETRASVLRNVADNQAFIDREYSTSFVLTEYFGYLRRDPDAGGFNFWLGQVNRFPIRDIAIQHAMVCSFITSGEYQQRFSSIVTHSNAECPQ